MIERTLSRIIGLSIYVIPSSLRQHSVIPSSLRPFILSSLHPLIPSSLIGWVSCDYFIVEISHYHNHSFTICTPHSVYPNYFGKFLEVHGFPRTVPMWTCSIRVFNSLQYHIFNIIKKIRKQIVTFAIEYRSHMFLDNIPFNHAQS